MELKFVKLNFLILLLSLSLVLIACSGEKAVKAPVKEAVNPFFADYGTPHEVPAFDKIKAEHYMPAFKKGMEEQKKEIEAIVNKTEEPDFENTIEAMELTGALLTKVESVFFNLTSAETNDELQKIQKDVTPLLSKHSDDINLNAKLFARVKAVYDKRDKLNLNQEQQMVLKKYYQGFVRGGAELKPEDQDKLRKLNAELSMLALKFGENLLNEVKTFEMVLDKKEDLAGLPESVIAGAAETAKARGHEGKWAFTLDKPSWIPFLQYSTRRDLREKLYKGYINKGNNNNELDNKKVISKMAALRVEKANLLGFKTYAAYIVDKNMAKTPANVYKLLNQLWKAALPIAKKEAAELQKMINKEGGKFKLASWDWWYYAEKLRKEKYNLDENQLRPYFKLDNVRDGAFHVAKQLFGIEFVERTDIPKYHKDVQTFEVKDKDGKFIGIFLMDFHPRPGKRGGAWMNSYRKQVRIKGKQVYPVIVNVCNFSKPVGDKPALISFDEVETLFHEFGHGLHGLLSNCTYNSVSGTSVPRDFVELPSQLMEHWASQPEVLKVYAKHYKTGEVIPQELIKKLENSSHFNQGFGTTEYLAAALLDMNWHTLTEAKEVDTTSFENDYLKKIGLIPEIISRYRSTYFSHITGGYAAGYYVYIWAAVLDNDAFEAFKEKGNIYDQETATKLRKFIYGSGGSDEAMKLYKSFRGADPKIEPLLKNRGLK